MSIASSNLRIGIANRDQSSVGGQEIIAQLLANGLARRGYSVSVLTTDHPPGGQFSELSKDISVTVLAGGHRVFDEQLSSRDSLHRLHAWIKSQDVVLLNNPFSVFGWHVLRAPRARNGRLYTSFHGKGFSQRPLVQLLNAVRRNVLLNLANHQSDGLIFLSDEDRGFFSKRILGTARPSHVIGNGVDTDFFHSNMSRPSVSLTSSERVFRVLFVGRLLATKGVEDLLEARTYIKAPRMEFCFAGTGPLASRIERTPGCRLLGVLDRATLRDTYQHSDVFVLPSYSECFPVTILEAMSMELPVIASDIFGIATILGSDTNILLPPREPEQLAKAIEIMLWTSPEDRARRGQANRQRVVEKFSAERMVEDYERVLQL